MVHILGLRTTLIISMNSRKTVKNGGEAPGGMRPDARLARPGASAAASTVESTVDQLPKFLVLLGRELAIHPVDHHLAGFAEAGVERLVTPDLDPIRLVVGRTLL